MAEPRTSSGGCYGVHVVHVAGRSTQTKQNPSKTRALLKKRQAEPMTKPVHQKYQIYPNLTKASWNSSDPFWVQRWCPDATTALKFDKSKAPSLQPAVSLPLLFSSPAPQTQTKNTKGNMESRDGPPGQARPPSPSQWLRLLASLLITKLHPSLQCLSIPNKTSAMVLLGLSSLCLLPQVIATTPWVRQKNVNVYWSQT